jgi:hypothetical protein
MNQLLALNPLNPPKSILHESLPEFEQDVVTRIRSATREELVQWLHYDSEFCYLVAWLHPTTQTYEPVVKKNASSRLMGRRSEVRDLATRIGNAWPTPGHLNQAIF